MGDIIHTLPALTDAVNYDPTIQFDWVVEKSFQEIPLWHKAVKQVIPAEIRSWRKKPLQLPCEKSFKNFIKQIRSKKYDLIIDAQGLVKSAWITKVAKGQSVGFNIKTAREHLAGLFYNKTYPTDWSLHAVSRMRNLFADSLGYSYQAMPLDYGICQEQLPQSQKQDYIVFLHGTTWPTKHWPESYWKQLAEKLSPNISNILLPWGNEKEKQSAENIARVADNIEVLPKMDLTHLSGILRNAKLIYAVDTGLGHIAAALETPTISLFGATDLNLTGAYGKNQYHLDAQFSCAPCLKRVCTHPDYKPDMPPCYQTINPDIAYQKGKVILGV